MGFAQGYTPWNKGMKGLTNIGSFKKGMNKSPKAGMKKGHKKGSMPTDWKQKISLGRKGKDISSEGQVKRKANIPRGEQHYKWLEDRSSLKKYDDKVKDRRSYAYNHWRKQVWQRDNFKCMIADATCAGRLEAHHILGWTDYPESRYQLNNGITLCHVHHPRKRADEQRMLGVFKQLVLEPLTNTV